MSSLGAAEALKNYRLVRRIRPSAMSDGEAQTMRFGEIWVAEDLRTQPPRLVVLKHTGSVEIFPTIARLLQNDQLESQARLVQLLDYFISSGEVIAASPYLASGTLADALPRLVNASPMQREDEALKLVKSMHIALAWLHGGNAEGVKIIHNDIKPSNIFLSGDTFLLGDFDDSLIHAPYREGGNPDRATARYAPPERFAKGYTTQGDYWSFGLVLAELLLGKHPFDASSEDGFPAVDPTNLPPGWRPATQKFLSLPRDWQALIYGLTTLRAEARWGASQLKRWLSSDEGVRNSVVDEVLEFGNSSFRLATKPFTIGSTSVRSVEAAAEAILLGETLADVQDPSELANWVENSCSRPIAAGRIRQTVDIPDLEERRLHIALSLDRKCPLAWRQIAMSRNQIADFARNDSENASMWVQTLKTSDPLAIYGLALIKWRAVSGLCDGLGSDVLERDWAFIV